MASTNTNSLFTSKDGKLQNRTGVALSTMVIVKVGNITIGAIQKIDVKENRPIKMFSEVGTDGIIDSSPTGSTTYNGSCERLRYDGVRIFEAFGCGFLHLKSMRVPINIDIIDTYTATGKTMESPIIGDTQAGGTEISGLTGSIITTLENVWFKDLSYTYTQDNWQVSDTASFEFETISSYRSGTPGFSAASGGERGISPFLTAGDPYVQAADSGKRRGALDAPGLITIGFKAT